MKIADFLSAMKAKNPKVFAKMNDVQVRQVTASAIDEIGKMIDGAADDAVVAIPSLGRFKIKMVPSKEDPNVKVRRVIFLRAKPSPAKPGKAK